MPDPFSNNNPGTNGFPIARNRDALTEPLRRLPGDSWLSHAVVPHLGPQRRTRVAGTAGDEPFCW